MNFAISNKEKPSSRSSRVLYIPSPRLIARSQKIKPPPEGKVDASNENEHLSQNIGEQTDEGNEVCTHDWLFKKQFIIFETEFYKKALCLRKWRSPHPPRVVPLPLRGRQKKNPRAEARGFYIFRHRD